MGAVHVEGTAAVAGHQLDRLPGRHRAAEDRLLSARECRNLLRAIEVVDHPERDQHERHDHRERQQDAHDRPHQIDPEVAEFMDLVLRKSTDQRNADTHANGAAHERLHTKATGQPDMPKRGFTGIVLPTGVRSERNSSVEGQSRCHTLVAPGLGQNAEATTARRETGH